MAEESKGQFGLWLCCLLLLGYVLTYSGTPHSIDEKAVLAVTETLVNTGQWNANQMEWEQLWRPSQNAYGVDGDLYAKKGPAISVLALPLFAWGQKWPGIGAVQVAVWTNIVVAFATLLCFYWMALRLKYALATAAVATFALAFGTLQWTYARTLFSEPLGALGVCMALWGSVTFRRGSVHQQGWGLLMVSLGLAIVVLAKAANVIVGAFFVGYVIYVGLLERHECRFSRRAVWRGLLLFGIVGISIALTIAYNYARFRSFLVHPLDPKEHMGFPTWMGIIGLLFSSGKGIFWFVPLTWLALPAVKYWPEERRRPDYLLAAGVAALPVIFYSAWSDWDGGRAWGPRMLVYIMPALVMLCLPMLDKLANSATVLWQRLAIGAVLLLSVCAQLPGVLVNFGAQEGLDLQTGVDHQEIVWVLQHSPLLSYWRAIGSVTSDPVWLHAFFWQNSAWLLLSMTITVGAILSLAIVAWKRQRDHGRPVWAFIAGQAILLLSLAVGLTAAARHDPRWHESTTDASTNIALLDYLDAHSDSSTLVLLDLIRHFDIDGRSWFWMNTAPAERPYIGWLRKENMSNEDSERLQRWFAPYDRIWLSLVGTHDNEPGSTTEQWLEQYAYPGRKEWIGDQRVAEYLNPVRAKIVHRGQETVRFGDGVRLQSYRVARVEDGEMWLIDLVWAAEFDGSLSYSVQALAADGGLLSQVDRALTQPRKCCTLVTKAGISGAPELNQIILKVYETAHGTVLPARRTSDTDSHEYVTIFSARDSASAESK